MILIDTSVWVDHFRRRNPRLIDLLEDDKALTHPFVIGELACGNLKNRTEILILLSEMPQATLAHHEEVLSLIDLRHLNGRGIGWIDAHLLASARLSHAQLWTADKKLRAVALEMGVLAS